MTDLPPDERDSVIAAPRNGAVDHALDVVRSSDAHALGDTSALFAELESAVEKHDRAPLAGARDLSTSTRVVLATSIVTLAVFAFGASTSRPDLATHPASRVVTEILVLTLALGLGLTLSLRPLSRPALRATTVVAWVSGTLALALLLALIPNSAVHVRDHLASVPETLGPLAPRHWSARLPCLWIGMIVGVPTYVLARVLDRGQRASHWLSAAAAGVASNLALALHCASGDVAHKLSTHASIGFVFVACLALAAAIETLISGRRPQQTSREP